MKKRDHAEPTSASPGGLARWLTLLPPLAFTLVLCAALASGLWHVWLQKEYPEAADRFGYLEMARDIRQGSAPNGLPRFTYDGAHARLMLDFLRARGANVDNALGVSPAAYHYSATKGTFICQYPPGIAEMLSLLPEGKAVITWRLLALAVLAGLGFWRIVRAFRAPSAAALTAAGLTVIASFCAIEMMVFDVSYSADFLILPLLASVAAGFHIPQRRPMVSRVLAFVAGLALGWGVVIRIAAALFLPGLSILALPDSADKAEKWHQRALRLAAMWLGFACGVAPLLWHQRLLTGSPFQSTYAAADVSAPSFAFLARNLAYYFWGDGSDFTLAALAGAIAFTLWAWPRRDKRAQPAARFNRAMAAIAVVLSWAIPTGFYLLHEIVTPYYQLPTLFAALLGLSFIASRQIPGSGSQTVEHRWSLFPIVAVFLLTAATLAYGAVIPWPTRVEESASVMPDTTLPPALRNPNAWILADRLAGTLWYYHGIESESIMPLNAPTRQAFFQWLKTQNQSIYMLVDNPLMEEEAKRLRGEGWTFVSAGSFGSRGTNRPTPYTAVYQLVWRN